jgi:putative membrane protein
MPKTRKEERVLILCVDRDDDLGVKAEVKAPLLGREENLNAAVRLALRDPEEPDANAMFEAVRIYDRLRQEVETPENCQIATITGSELGDVGADKKLVSQLIEVLKAFPASDVILVTDGYSDEAILPLIESRVPITSVRRVVMKHSKSIEETAALFSRYLKILVENPRYSRILLGLPGILLIILGALRLLEFPLLYTGIAFLLVLGAVLLVKGFGLDKAATGFYKWIREYSPPPLRIQIAGFSAVAGSLLVMVGCYLGAVSAANAIPTLYPPPEELGQWISHLPKLAGHFISGYENAHGSILPIVIGICVLLSGRAIRWFFERDSRLWRTIVIVVVVAWSWTIFSQAGQVLINPGDPLYVAGLVFAIITGVPLTLGIALVIYLLHRKHAAFFREKEEEVEKSEEG